MKQQSFPMSRREDIVVRELKDEILIYDLKSNKALNKLNAFLSQSKNPFLL